MAAIKKTSIRKSAVKAEAQPAIPVKAAPQKAAPKAEPVRKADVAVASAPRSISSAEFKRMVEEAAYYRAEKSGFGGNPSDHWDAAEKEIRAQLGVQKIKIG